MQHRMAERVTNYIREQGGLAGARKKEEVVSLFDNLLKLMPSWAIMTCPVLHPDIRYISPNAPDVLGYSMEYLRQHTAPEYFFQFVHEADKTDLQLCFSHVHDYLQTISEKDTSKYRCVFHYRFIKPGGPFVYLHDEKAILDLGEAGLLYYVLLRDITSEKKFSGVKVEILRQDKTQVRVAEYKPVTGNLTNRENELVTLIQQGLSTKEIAWYLKISHHTVRNIKSRLFEKFNVNNSIELLNMTA